MLSNGKSTAKMTAIAKDPSTAITRVNSAALYLASASASKTMASSFHSHTASAGKPQNSCLPLTDGQHLPFTQQHTIRTAKLRLDIRTHRTARTARTARTRTYWDIKKKEGQKAKICIKGDTLQQ